LIFGLAAILLSLSNPTFGQNKSEGKKQDETKADKPNYRLVVSFYSIGAGTNGKARRSFSELIEKFEKEHKIKLAVKDIAWGREGERDYCLALAELKPQEQTKFITSVKSLLEKEKWTRVSENVPCKTGR
jgi:ABC-type glycerol-3-phosphate transport system substrate-binding protein